MHTYIHAYIFIHIYTARICIYVCLSSTAPSRHYQVQHSTDHCQARTTNFGQSGDRKFQLRSCPWHPKQHGQSILNFIKIELQQILNNSTISHEDNFPSIMFFKIGKIRVQHELLITDSSTWSQCWQSTAGPKWSCTQHGRPQCYKIQETAQYP